MLLIVLLHAHSVEHVICWTKNAIKWKTILWCWIYSNVQIVFVWQSHISMFLLLLFLRSFYLAWSGKLKCLTKWINISIRLIFHFFLSRVIIRSFHFVFLRIFCIFLSWFWFDFIHCTFIFLSSKANSSWLFRFIFHDFIFYHYFVVFYWLNENRQMNKNLKINSHKNIDYSRDAYHHW